MTASRADSPEPVLAFERVVKRCFDGSRTVAVLDGVSLTLERGAFAGLYGPRRSGKSTLLRLAAGMERADEGTIRLAGRDTGTLSAIGRARLLRETVGYVSPEGWCPRAQESVIDRLVLALGCAGYATRKARHRAYQALDEVGLAGAGLEPTTDLPLGERMALMLACALVHEPALLLVDEPAAIASVSARERFGELVRTAAQTRRLATIVASEELATLQGVTVAMSIGSGEVTSTRRRGVVVPFPGPQREAGGRFAL